jgi:hypothetical protein
LLPKCGINSEAAFIFNNNSKDQHHSPCDQLHHAGQHHDQDRIQFIFPEQDHRSREIADRPVIRAGDESPDAGDVSEKRGDHDDETCDEDHGDDGRAQGFQDSCRMASPLYRT